MRAPSEESVQRIYLAADDFDASAWGLDQATIEARIHGQLPDGRIVEGVDVFVHLYEALDRALRSPRPIPDRLAT